MIPSEPLVVLRIGQTVVNYEGHPKSKFPYLVSSERKEINQIGKEAHIRHTLSFKTSSSF